MNTSTKISQYFAYKEQLNNIPATKQIIIDSIITQDMKDKLKIAYDLIYTEEIKKQLEDIDIEFLNLEKGANENINKLDIEIRAEVIEFKQTIKDDEGKHMCIYRKGSLSWDGDKLIGFAVAHPEILTFSTQGKPSVAYK